MWNMGTETAQMSDKLQGVQPTLHVAHFATTVNGMERAEGYYIRRDNGEAVYFIGRHQSDAFAAVTFYVRGYQDCKWFTEGQ